MQFSDLGLDEKTLKAVDEAGFKSPTPIQSKTIPIFLDGKDVLASAQTGTGKSASFLLPLMCLLSQGRARARMPRALILEPTRELAAQLDSEFKKLGKHHKLNSVLIVGGESMEEQERLLAKGADVLIVTPGRLLDLFSRGRILLTAVKYLVIDEADRMLDMGFIPDLKEIVRKLPAKRQTLLFSATMPSEIRKLAHGFLVNPEEVAIESKTTTAETIDQYLVKLDFLSKKATEQQVGVVKRAALRYLLEKQHIEQAIIFCNRKRDVDSLNLSLKRHGYDSEALHGDFPQSKRREILDSVKSGDVHILVASDVAARGLHIDEISHVFSFDVPTNPEEYVHRIGRTGRAGKSGESYLFETPKDHKLMQAVITAIGHPIDAVDLSGFSAPDYLAPASKKKMPAKGQGAKVTESQKPSVDDLPRKDESQPRKEALEDRRERRHNWNRIETETLPEVGFGETIPAFMKVIPASTGPDAKKSPEKSKKKK
ncbi:MAG: DEAD/DEAH box helicase [Alphaproteobacteria bacterium]|jgi:superfamily II DNA/RNA helicase|nr:DEAD/DEAH box helicase [Alphaproteobacteria bacterium]MBT5389993.1 DEAD/DEAH box helicase [Alphaproteobacteria bacterium]